MGIFKRVKNILASDIHEALDKCEDPIRMLNQYLRELEQEIGKAEDALSNQFYIEKKYDSLVTDTEEQLVKRTRQAGLAVEREEDEIAKMAIKDKLLLEKKLAIYKPQLEVIRGKTVELCQQIKQLKEKYEELQTRKMILISRANVAKVSNDIARTVIAFKPENAVRGFARMEDQILKLEAKSATSQYLLKGQSTQSENDNLIHEEVESELKRLKESKEQTV